MIPGAFGLLNLIGVAGRALSGGGRSQPAMSSGELASLDFDALLDKARDGGMRSGTPVVLGAGVDVELSDEQLQRLTLAADRAAASGAGTALVLMDGMALRLDVESRRIESMVDADSGAMMTDVDAVITAPPGAAPSAHGPGGMPSNESVMRLLAESGN